MKLNYKRTLLVGLAFFSISAFWQVYDGIIPLILRETFGISDTLSGVVMAADNVLALFMLPLFGMLSDITKTPLGRRMPYILGGTAVACITALLIPLADTLRNLPLFLISLGITLVAMSTFRSPAVALMPDVTPKPLRSKGNAVINLMGAVGGILALGLIALLVSSSQRPSYFPIFIAVVALMAGSAFVLFKKVNEPMLVHAMEEESLAIPTEAVQPQQDLPQLPAAPQAKTRMSPEMKRSFTFLLLSVFLWFMGYNAVTTAFSKYARVYWGLTGGSYAYTLMVAQAAAIVSFLPVGFVASKIGRKKTILFGVLLLALAFGCAILFTTFSAAVFFLFALAGVGWASINVNSYPMVVEMCKEADVGKYTGYYYTFSMSAQIITPILSGAVMQYIGYKYLFPYATMFVALAFFTMLRVHHGDNRPGLPQSALELYDAGDD